MTTSTRPVSRQHLKRFTLRFAGLMTDGHSLAQCLATAGRLERNRHIAQALIEMQLALMRSGTLYEAMAQYPDIFDDAYVQMIKEGAYQGRLTEAMLRYADRL